MADKTPPRGNIDKNFALRLAELRKLATSQADSVTGDGTLGWNVPAGWSGDPLDIAGATKPFDRADVGANYASLVADAAAPGTAGSAIGVKLQSDYLAMLERAARTRYLSPVRRAIMAAARRAGHGTVDGVLSRVEAEAYGAIALGDSATGDPPRVPAGGKTT